MDAFDFQLPDDPPDEMVAVVQLAGSLATLTAAVEALHQQYLDLRENVTQTQSSGSRKVPAGMPWPLNWRDLDREAAAEVWAWLIDWVGWATDRYQLTEEIPACWYQHPPLLDELTALAAAWHGAYDQTAAADSPLLWLERLARARIRLRDWDDYTRCRNGTHTDRHVYLAWPGQWQHTAVQVANADLVTRPSSAPATTTLAPPEKPTGAESDVEGGQNP